ncbi:proton pump-interactor 1 [Phtheirospermum japonicum]|uniref:Proton pump-interactor 1 n=1 Tax=Phtheirospermum japonicum TaxID=374723 RepID=A0A830CHT6_9LAMI|nr:proton pump-interactor 1 [Phtheirospermum japonicum]
MMSETEEVSKEVVGIEAQCQDLPKPECNGNDLDALACAAADINASSPGEISGKGIRENQIGGSGMVAEPPPPPPPGEEEDEVVETHLESDPINGKDVVEDEIINLSVESNPTINTKEEDELVQGKEGDETGGGEGEVVEQTVVELQHEPSASSDERVEIAKPASTSLDLNVLESNPVNTKEAIGVAVGVESQGVIVKGTEDDEVKLSEGEVVQVPTSTSSGLVLESNPINTEENVNVVERESNDESVEMLSEGEGVQVAEHEVPSSASLDLNLESKPIDTKEEVDVVANAVECDDLQDTSVKAEVVETAEHEILNLESKPIDTKEEVDVVVNAVECDDLQDTSVKAEVVETAEHEILNLESKPIDTKEEVDVVVNAVECDDLQDTSVKAEVVETAEHEILNLESMPITTEENIVDVVANVVERESQDASMKAIMDEVKLSDEVVENAEHENLNLESNPVSSKEEEIDAVANVVECDLQDASVKAEDEVKLSGEVVENADRENLDLESMPINTKDNIVDVVADESQDATVKAQDEVKLSGEVVENAERETLDLESNLVNTNEETVAVMDVVERESQDPSVKSEDEVKLSGEVVENAERENLDLESMPINTKDNIVDVVADESRDATVKAQDEVNLSGELVENAERETLDLESNLVNANEDIVAVMDVVERESQDPSVKAEEEVKLSGEVVEIAQHEVPLSSSDVTLEPEVHVRNFSAISSGVNSSDVNKEGAANNIELEIEAVEDKVVQIDDENGNSQDSSTPVAPPRVEEASDKTKRKPFNFLVRVPRFDNESLREQIRLAKINVDEKTKLRDAIQVQIQEKRASTQIHGIDYEYAKGESRNARKLVRSKRIEIDSLQSVINKAKNALSIGDIDSQIYNMEHMIQHETLPLKEEKQLIREIKQLKQLREQLSSNIGSKDEIKQALEQREEVEERLKILRKELDSLKGKVVKAEATAVEAEKKYDAENKKIKEIQAQFRAADDVRQEAYVHWQSLRKELSKKSEYFYKYKDDSAVASNCVFSRDTDMLYRLCTNNVEKFMELWNTNDEFRRDYVKFNTRSTVWRLGTLDGRSLGPDEMPPVLPSYADTRVNRNVSTPSKVDLKSQFPTLEPKQEKTTQSVTSDGKSTIKSTEEKNRRLANKEPAISEQANGSDIVSVQDIIINEVHEEPKISKDEIQAIKKAEERERKEAEAKLKEERRLEALAKASEARERKKRQAEKLQMRAEMKTIKEAEQKEKEREKRLRKKERKKAAATDVNDTNGSKISPSSESAAETSKDVEVKDVSSVAAPKTPKKHWLFGKQSKAKSTIPPPLRNRNKKKLQQWMWVGITSFVILVLFCLGNMGVFSNVHFKRRSPVI